MARFGRMLDVNAPADEVGITAIAAAARAATRGLGGDGDAAGHLVRLVAEDARQRLAGGDRKSTRLNSSHRT